MRPGKEVVSQIVVLLLRYFDLIPDRDQHRGKSHTCLCGIWKRLSEVRTFGPQAFRPWHLPAGHDKISPNLFFGQNYTCPPTTSPHKHHDSLVQVLICVISYIPKHTPTHGPMCQHHIYATRPRSEGSLQESLDEKRSEKKCRTRPRDQPARHAKEPLVFLLPMSPPIWSCERPVGAGRGSSGPECWRCRSVWCQ